MELAQDYVDAVIAAHEAALCRDRGMRARMRRAGRCLAIGAAYLGGGWYGLGFVMHAMVQRG
jgi:hypothetical protein